MRISIFTALLIFVSHESRSETITVDSIQMQAPNNIASIVRADPEYTNLRMPCGLVAYPVQLLVNSKIQGYIVTTENGCEWGTNLAPLWLVAPISHQHKVVLAVGGNGVDIQSEAINGAYIIKVFWAINNESHEAQYTFNGNHYIVSLVSENPIGHYQFIQADSRPNNE
jgi:hypothetical protein